ncbi:hypothetical protein [Deinococcus actinosclerus]|uniref:Lipoprotein n=1 Tax=Deinococcus actinosclerus TaxID=1768108 RepID=A0ABM5X2R6_9DEIO|nr:hypothetical protein [Deinococcus actinosclerus]ALW87949.1 hypothetical protein AUC44_02745 [Deinococcus actinosclerus]
MRNIFLLPLFTLLVGCAPGATITSAGRSFDRVQVGEEWVIEYTLNGMSERGTFTITRDARPLTCGSPCENIESIAYMEAKVLEESSGQVTLWTMKTGERSATFSTPRLGRFAEVNCFVILGAKEDTFKASITPNGAAKSESGSCRVLSVR